MEPPIPGLILASIIAAGAVAVLSWLFVWRYSRVTWKRTREGQHVMRLSVLLGLTFTAQVVFYVAPIRLIWQAVTTVLLFGGIAAEMWARNALFSDAQRHDKGGD